MRQISNVDNYYNTFDATKGYTELLFRAGKVLQSKEVNELQSVLKEQIKNVGNTILTDGDKIEGCQLIIKGTEATITDGKIYLSGNVREIKKTTVQITGKGNETIGAIIEKEVVTPTEDPDLFDKASGFDNYNRDGAYRLRENVKIVVNDPKASIMFTLVDGEQTKVNTSEDLTQLDKVNLTLARRTFDESGNYKINGLEITNRNKFDDRYVYVSVEPGKAYVKGFEVMKLASTTVALDRADSTKDVANEPKVYHATTNTYTINNPFTTDVSISATVQVKESIRRGGIVGGQDFLNNKPVLQIVSVKQGHTTYKEGVDFQLTADSIDWSLNSGNAPSGNSTYEVIYRYTKTMSKDLEYSLSKDKDHNTVIKFLAQGTSTDTSSIKAPVDGTIFYVTYKFKLFRRDVIAIDKDGRILITKGQPNILRLVESPSVTDQEVLVLGSVLVNPVDKNGETQLDELEPLQIINNRTQAIPMLDLYKILDRLSNLEYNQAVSDLDKQAVEGESTNQLIGVFTDGFLNFSKADVYHEQWDASIDLSTNELTLPYTESYIELSKKVLPESWGVGKEKLTRYTTDYTEVVELEQPFYTNVMRVNAYDAFPKTPVVQVSPDIDNWIETKELTVDGGTLPAVTLRRWWYAKSSSWAMEEKAKWEALGFKDGGASIGSKRYYSTNVDVVSKEVVDTAISYMRTKELTVTVSNLNAQEDNIIVTFDGFPVKMTADSLFTAGTDEGTLRANEKGIAKGRFTIPEKTECGTKEIRAYAKASSSYFGTANYTANGTKRTVTNTVFKQKVSAEPYDPVAQSFQFAEDKYLTAVSVYFQDKDTNEPITFQIRNTVNGYPGTIVYAEEIIQGTDITPGQEHKVIFKEPVYCNAKEMYCFTILSNSSVDTVQVAETNKTDIASGVVVAKNPYLAGTMFSSSNALTWTAHQAIDMRFKLFTAKFEPTKDVIFKVTELNKPSRFVIAAEEYIPAGCSISWSYKTSAEGAWNPCEKYTDVEFTDNAEVTEIHLKATISGKSNISAFIDIATLQMVLATNKLKASYVTRTIDVPNEGYNNAKIIVDLEMPSGTNVLVYYSTNGGYAWTPVESSSSPQPVTFKSKRYTFEAQGISKAKQFTAKLEFTTTTHNIIPKAKNLKCIMKTV